MVEIKSSTAENRQGKKKIEDRKKKPQDKNILACPIPQGSHKETTRRKHNVHISYAGQP